MTTPRTPRAHGLADAIVSACTVAVVVMLVAALLTTAGRLEQTTTRLERTRAQLTEQLAAPTPTVTVTAEPINEDDAP